MTLYASAFVLAAPHLLNRFPAIPDMPEALAVLFVFTVAAGVYVYAWLQAKNPSRQNAGQDQARLERHEAWLQHRLEIARRENWGADMIHSLEADLREAQQRLAEAAEPAARNQSN